MKVYIMVDFEGIAGMIEWDDYMTDTPFNQEKRSRLRHILTAEVNAAIEGVLAAGAKEVLVWDSHGPSNNCNNIYFEDLNPSAEIIIGWKGLPSFYPLLDKGYDVSVYIGGHAMAGSLHACVPHTKVNLNKRFYGEMGMFIAVCGSLNIPVIFVSGDQTAVAEVKELIPNVEYVITKIAFSPYSAKTLIPKKSQELIAAGCEKAMHRRKEIKPYKIEKPYIFYGAKGEIIVEGDNLFDTYSFKYIDPEGKVFNNQDIEPERSRFHEKNKSWREKNSFLVP